MKKLFDTSSKLRTALQRRMAKGGITQKELASFCVTSQSVISLFLRGKRGVNANTALRLQAFLLSEDGGEKGEER